MSERQRRKLDHVKWALQQPASRGPAGPGFHDIHLIHRSLPELALEQIDLKSSLCGYELKHPILINAMTGGAAGVESINRDLALLAAELDLPMALGSQNAGIKEPETARSYSVVREVNPSGIIMANLSADATLESAQRAVEMGQANILQIHLNAPQELVMAEGDRDFRGQLANIARLAEALPVPVLVKECGFGMSAETVRQLYAAGIQAVDISGRGGTNFAWIEAQRLEDSAIDPGLEQWGIPTACALAEAVSLGLPGPEIVASGGITFGSEAAKALALGASAVGIAGGVLRRHQAEGIEGARRYLQGLIRDLKIAALLVGAADLEQLQAAPLVVTGATAEWCRLRGVDLQSMAKRGDNQQG